MKARFSISPLALALILCVAGSAWADATVDAEKLVQQGIQLRKENQDAAALSRFREAWAKAPSPRIRAHIALTEQALGRFRDAEIDLQAALQSTDDPWIEKHRPTLVEAQEVISKHLGWIDFDPSARGMVRIDGERLVELPAASIRIETGDHELSLLVDGTVRATTKIAVRAHEHTKATLAIDEPAAAKAPVIEPPRPAVIEVVPPTPVQRDDRRGYRLAGATTFFVGVAALGAGTYFGVKVLTLDAKAKDRCPSDPCSDQNGVDARTDARKFARVTDVLLIGGAVVTVTGAALWLHGVKVAPAVGPGTASISLSGVF